MTIQDFEITALKGWLLLITAFEALEIFKFLFNNAPIGGFFSTLKNNRPEKRLWCMVLTFLMLSRLQAVFYMDSPGVLVHNSAVHILEATVFGYEKIRHGSNGGNAIFSVILINAIWFLSAAMRMDTI